MNDSFLDPDECLFDDALNSSSSAQAGNTAGDWSWLGNAYEPLTLDNPDSSGLQTNDIQPECLQHIPHAQHDGVSQKCPTSGHSFSTPHQGGYFNNSHTNNDRLHGFNPCPNIYYSFHQDIDGELYNRHASIYDSIEPFDRTQNAPGYPNNFRGGDEIPPTLLGAFSAADLGTLPQNPKLDDTITLASCNSRCASSVCEIENCSVTGVPCDDPTCVDSFPPAQDSDFTKKFPAQASNTLPLHQSHSQPCNHTESEHSVARTLGSLRAPGLHAQGRPTFNYLDALTLHNGGQFYSNGCGSYVTSPPQLTREIESCEPTSPAIPSEPTPSIPMTPNVANDQKKHICRWTAEGEMCGAEFNNTKDFHDHICESHIDKLSSQNGFVCSWAGCNREDAKPFVTRGKLRRHVSTHSVHKPYKCETCNQGFSGLQALQQHVRIHTGDKPFKCTFNNCTMAFKQKSALTMHLRTHTGEKPLVCNICGKAFPESSNLSKHRKTHMGKTDKYVCDEIVKGQTCGRSFRRLDQLRRHKDTHRPGKRKMSHKRSMSAASGEVLQFEQSPATPTPPQQ